LGLLRAGSVVGGIGLHGVHLKQVAAHGILNKRRHGLGIALRQIFDTAAEIVLSLA
jgi:hypothetical protein